MGRPKISKTAKTGRIGPKTGYVMPMGVIIKEPSSEVLIIKLFPLLLEYNSGLLCFALLCFAFRSAWEGL